MRSVFSSFSFGSYWRAFPSLAQGSLASQGVQSRSREVEGVRERRGVPRSGCGCTASKCGQHGTWGLQSRSLCVPRRPPDRRHHERGGGADTEGRKGCEERVGSFLQGRLAPMLEPASAGTGRALTEQ